MTLSTLLQGITYTSPSAPALLAGCEVDHITEDSRAVKPGTLFVALRGVHADGHRFVPAAIEAGARAVLVETLPEEQRGDGRLAIRPRDADDLHRLRGMTMEG